VSSTDLTAAQVLGAVEDQLVADLTEQFYSYVDATNDPVTKEPRPPRFLYVNQRQWEDAGPKLRAIEEFLGLKVLTSTLMPPDSAFLTRDEFPPDDLAKHLAQGGTVGLI
jgi:hypothetical protein